jgi:hypothetical protein
MSCTIKLAVALVSVVLGSSVFMAQRVEAGGGSHGLTIIASGHGYAAPTLLDPTRTETLASLIQLISPPAPTDWVPTDRSSRPRIELWLFRSTFVQGSGSASCPAGSFTYRADCASTVVSYYPPVTSDDGTVEAGVLVGRWGERAVDDSLLAILSAAGLTVGVDAPAVPSAVTSPLVAVAQPTELGPAEMGGVMALLLGAVFLAGAVMNLMPAHARTLPSAPSPVLRR